MAPSSTRQGKKNPIRVLSASIDRNLNRSRALLLRRYGFQVTTSNSPEHATEKIASSAFDVLIFGTTLPRDTCWQLADVFRRRNSRGKIIEIIPAAWSAPKNKPDATVVSTDQAEALITTIQQLRGGTEGA
jgi:CheY-like chemotaxis protein